MARFSVVVPAYNAAPFVEETLRSIREQTFGDFECIVVDDGSTDATRAVVAAATAGDDRFRIVTIEHSGLAATARNVGVAAGRGEYVAFLDADDVWLPTKLARFDAHIRATGADVVFSNGYLIDEDGNRTSPLLSPRMKRVIPARDPFMVLSNFVPLSSAVVRRELLAAHPFSESPDIRGTEDYRLWLELNLEAAFEYLPEDLLRYRVHANQLHGDYGRGLVHHDIVISGEEMEAGYGPAAIALARRLIDLRRRFVAKQWRMLARDAVSIPRGLGRREWRALGEYLRYGLLQRSKTLLRQRRRGGIVRI